MATLRYEETENEEELFGVFRSPAFINGEEVLVGVNESRSFKQSTVMRGFVDDDGKGFRWAGWKEELVATLRHASTPEGYNHEWWSQHVSKPEWLTRLEKMVMKLWIHYPLDREFAEAKEIGSRLGYELTLHERKCDDAFSDLSLLEHWESQEFKSELAGVPHDFRERTEVLFLGAKSFVSHVSARLKWTKELRKFAFQLSQEGDLKESQDFLAGYQLGSARANEICDHKLYWQFNERQEIAETMQGYWTTIESLPTLTEVSAFIRKYLPDHTKEFLAQNAEADVAFADRCKKLYQKIGLKKGSAGRPRK